MSNLIGQSLGRYHIIEQLGEGGMATVYKAYDTRLERDVAIKIIRRNAFPPEQLERILKRFEREAKSLAKLSHPNIVGVLDYGEHDGSPYLVLVYLPGGILKKRMGQPMPWQEAVRLLIPIANALDYAHEQKVIHRDVKPANILLTVKGQPMLSDFGIAKILEMEDGHTLTGTGMGIGTPEYMSPEQGMGREVDGRADIYSLGIIFYELITGRKPYKADTPMAVILKHMTVALPSPRQFIPDLPDAAEKVLIKSLAKDPKDRYPDAGAFALAMENLIRGDDQSRANIIQPLSRIPNDTSDTIDTFEVTSNNFSNQRLLAHPIDKKNLPSNQKGITLSIWVGLGLTVIILVGALTRRGLLVGDEPTKVIPVSTEMAAPAASEISPLVVPRSIVTGNDGMILLDVPAGEFEMGSSVSGSDIEKPVHTVYLDDFLIDQTEVTNAMYTLCVQASKCDQLDENANSSEPTNGQHPVAYVDWNNATAYCEWAGRRLPTEAEWEKAARGTDGRIYPWGDKDPSKDLLNFNSGNVSSTTPVGSYPNGASPYGAFDMAGNVWEWVADWFDDNYYRGSGDLNPQGPSSGQYRVIRDTRVTNPSGQKDYEFYGGSAIRGKGIPSYTGQFLGFRCARDPIP